MRFKDLFKMARENLFRRKLRTSLTILSIVIGTVSIVLMIALGIGIQSSVEEQFTSFGSVNVLEVSKTQTETKTSRFQEETKNSGLSDSDLEYLGSLDGVDGVAPTISTRVKLVSSQYETYVNAVGYDPALMSLMGFKVQQGSLLSDNYHYDILFGDKALEGFAKTESDNPNAAIQRPDEESDSSSSGGGRNGRFGGNPFNEAVEKEYPVNPLTERFKMNLNISEDTSEGVRKLYSFNGVGILEAGDSAKDYNVYVPIKVLDKLLKEYTESRYTFNADGTKEMMTYTTSYSTIMVKVNDLDRVTEIQAIIEAKGYSVFSLMSILDTINQTLGVLQIALGAIGGISLFVAAIGITNTMVMAITERKKEIGIMKVIGATFKDIKRLFLLESALIGLLGGIIGIALCVGLSKLISSPMFSRVMSGGDSGTSFAFTIPQWLILAGLVFTTLIGVLSGYLPALKAMRSSALEAIRNE